MLSSIQKIHPFRPASLNWLPPIAIFLLPSVLYLKTLLPGLGGSGDTAKFQFIGKILGIPHAPGYPLYVLLNWLFVQLPVKSVAFRANLMSAFFSVLTILILYYLVLTLFQSRWVSFFSSLLVALSLSFWCHSVIAEVYSLNSFFVSLVFLALVKWKMSRRARWLNLFLLLYPLSFGNHLTMITLLPAILLFVIQVEAWTLIKPRFIAAGLAGITATLGLYSYLFIRSFQRAPYLEHRVVDLKSLFNVVSGGQFRYAMFPFSFRQVILERLPLFFFHLTAEWPILLLVLACPGLLFFFKKDAKLALLFVLSFLGQAFYILNYDIPDLDPFFIPLVLFLSLFTAAGIKFLFDLAGKRSSLKYFIVIGVILVTIWQAGKNYPRADRSGERKDDIRLTTLFSYIPEGSLVITDNYRDKQYVNYKIFIDFPQKLIIHLEISSEEEDLWTEISDNLFQKIRANQKIQAWLIPEDYSRLSPDEIENLIREDPALQEKLLAHVYLISEDSVKMCARQGFKIKAFALRAPGALRKFTFYQAFFLPQFEK